MNEPVVEFLSAGGNRHPSAADWASDCLVFGSNSNIAIWNPEDPDQNGIAALLTGHSDTVNAIKIYDHASGRKILSGSSDNTVRVWDADADVITGFRQSACLDEHKGSVNTIAILPSADIFVSGSADGSVKVWGLAGEQCQLAQSITLTPRYLPLATALVALPTGDLVLAVAGTSSKIQIFIRRSSSPDFGFNATLTGHEGWVRSLDFTQESAGAGADILLASASQDKYIRLWRFQPTSSGKENVSVASDVVQEVSKELLSNKSYQIGGPGSHYSITFEALLIGHEDWIYTARWAPTHDKNHLPALLSASADNSLSIWNADSASGVWICSTRLGEISSQKGSTTATGSTGGFWIGLWQPQARSVVSLGRTGSWRRWQYDHDSDMWTQQNGISGHVEAVQGLAWSPKGSYLVSTGADQTTRLLAQWHREGISSWHEFARPQIHGYDLNCIATVNEHQLISGADEKLLRVFNKPRSIDALLSRLCGIEGSTDLELPDAANIPVLGLSNKAVAVLDDDETNGEVSGTFNDREDVNPASVPHKNTLDLDQPPFEDHLARHTLWPEHEKLYGHGYEIAAVAASKDGSLVATACKASSIDHAVIRIFECNGWREVKPPLTAHSLTVTTLAFSADDRYLLSVGRDRQWSLFARAAGDPASYTLHASDPKGHSRMILGCSWAPIHLGHVFATVSRDKSIRIWRVEGNDVRRLSVISAKAAITAVAFEASDCGAKAILAYGTETGSIAIVQLEGTDLTVSLEHHIHHTISPSKTINALAWRSGSIHASRSPSAAKAQLAVASDDCSVRIYNI